MTDEQILHLHRAAPAKPAPGQPCNGCGVCCTLTTCPLARLRYLRKKGPCPALEWSEAERRYHCGLLTQPARHFSPLPAAFEATARRLFARWISSGSGCDCTVEIQD